MISYVNAYNCKDNQYKITFWSHIIGNVVMVMVSYIQNIGKFQINLCTILVNSKWKFNIRGAFGPEILQYLKGGAPD